MNALHKRGFPDAKFLDDQTYWEERRQRPQGGTSAKHQHEKEVRRQQEEKRRREEEALASSSSRAAEKITQEEKLRLAVGMVKSPLICEGVALSAALTFEDALVEEGKDEPVYWTHARLMAKSLRGGYLLVAPAAFLVAPETRCDQEGGRALMDIVKKDLPMNQEVWQQPHT